MAEIKALLILTVAALDLAIVARRCGVTIGMRKTSVEQLTEAVGISKGSFYKFFDSKP